MTSRGSTSFASRWRMTASHRREELLYFMLDAQYPHTMTLASAASAGIVRTTAVEERDGTPQPAAFSLAQNYPNPFNAATLISYSVPSESRAILDIFNIHGATRGSPGPRSGGRPEGTRSPGAVWMRRVGLWRAGSTSIVCACPAKREGLRGQTRKMLLLR